MKSAYHRLLFPDGRVVAGPVVVETDAAGRFVGWHRLLHEEPGTVWRGGEYKILINKE